MNQERIYKVLLGPHVSEKAALGAENGNQVVFKVATDASKPEIRRAVEKLFDVQVQAVRTVKVKGKVKRNRFGWVNKPNWKKAYVRLAPGQEIDLMAGE